MAAWALWSALTTGNWAGSWPSSCWRSLRLIRREAREWFLREAWICVRLRHPGIIPIHELGWLGERSYFSMKLVIGQSLGDLLDARPHPGHELPCWLEIFAHVCETVAYARLGASSTAI